MRVSLRFREAFDLCMAYYGCSMYEIEYEKQRARDNYTEAEKCFISIADEIRDSITGRNDEKK